MASMRSTVMAGSSSADSRVPGPPPRTSIEATAGSSNTTAVTPEPRLASSAWPTRTPATSVMRLWIAVTMCTHRQTERSASYRVRPAPLQCLLPDLADEIATELVVGFLAHKPKAGAVIDGAGGVQVAV